MDWQPLSILPRQDSRHTICRTHRVLYIIHPEYKNNSIDQNRRSRQRLLLLWRMFDAPGARLNQSPKIAIHRDRVASSFVALGA